MKNNYSSFKFTPMTTKEMNEVYQGHNYTLPREAMLILLAKLIETQITSDDENIKNASAFAAHELSVMLTRMDKNNLKLIQISIEQFL